MSFYYCVPFHLISTEPTYMCTKSLLPKTATGLKPLIFRKNKLRHGLHKMLTKNFIKQFLESYRADSCFHFSQTVQHLLQAGLHYYRVHAIFLSCFNGWTCNQIFGFYVSVASFAWKSWELRCRLLLDMVPRLIWIPHCNANAITLFIYRLPLPSWVFCLPLTSCFAAATDLAHEMALGIQANGQLHNLVAGIMLIRPAANS